MRLRTPRGGFGTVIGVRHVVVVAALLLIASAVGVVSLGTGDFAVPVGDVIATLFGGGDRRSQLVVLDWRMPRVALALMLGAALGASGAIFQSLTRNPLGSPDIIGFDAGAFTGALIVITTVGTGYLATAAGALGGGLAAAVVVYLLAYRRGFHGFRLIIVGIAVASMLASVNTWLLLVNDQMFAMAAAAWGAGSLNIVGWEQAVPAAGVLLVLWAVTASLARSMHVLELGDDAATALGVNVRRRRLALVVVGVALTATATAAAGPIAFIALAAPQLARRLTRSAGVTIAASAAMGAVLLSASDFVAQHAFSPLQLPVGIITVSVGGLYLIWLLIMEVRRR
ncbi:iron chelate uptake ABC transporter family permease subunit [Agromyces sp. LHK192]|uniref:FecCD family ABC transporter permease n=1 Tax=Agromyces sp. LHK192 TaxID=2498704 RepID=UPI000FDA0D86|nr:iron chelate uptake ABC transporter family permease subunit [Agromyces sp. LHK192]